MIRSLKLANFRLFDNLNLDFNNSFVILSGKNATGKTSILEAIHIAATTKSHRTIEISTNNTVYGDAREEVIPTFVDASNPITIGFSSRYLLEALKSFMSTEISLNLTGEIRPFVIRGEKDVNLTQLILPVRMD